MKLKILLYEEKVQLEKNTRMGCRDNNRAAFTDVYSFVFFSGNTALQA